MLSTAQRKPISFYNQDLYDSIKIPVRDYLLELTGDLELAVLLNQIIFSKKEKMTLNDIKKLSLNEKTKQTIRVKLERLIELGLIRKYKNNNIIYNQDLYEPTNKIISDNKDILALIDGSDLKYEFHYLTAIIINKFRMYALAGINEVRLSAKKLKSMLGVKNSESSIRAVLTQLVQDNYLSERELIDGTYNYKINITKITNNFSIEDIKKFTDEIYSIYSEYINKFDLNLNKTQLLNYKTTFKRMVNDGYDPLILKHIIIYLTLNTTNEFLPPSEIKKSYNKLNDVSKALSKRKAKRFFYKLQNNLLNTDNEKGKILAAKISDNNLICDEKPSNIELWYKAVNYIDERKTILQQFYYKSLAGVTHIDFEDYYQEALKITFEYFKKHSDIDDYTTSSIIYRLKEFMFHNRHILDRSDNTIVIYDIKNEEDYNYIINNNNTNIYESLCYSEDNTDNINNILSVLDERSRLVVNHYIGIDGISLNFKEIGSKLNIAESYAASIYKKAILLLKEHYPPDKMAEFKKILLNNI